MQVGGRAWRRGRRGYVEQSVSKTGERNNRGQQSPTCKMKKGREEGEVPSLPLLAQVPSWPLLRLRRLAHVPRSAALRPAAGHGYLPGEACQGSATE